MPLSPPRSLECFSIHNAQPAGPVIGKFGEEEISETIIDEFGRAYTYAGLAPRAWSGKLDADRLKSGEFLFKSGLVYRLASTPPTWVARLRSKLRNGISS